MKTFVLPFLGMLLAILIGLLVTLPPNVQADSSELSAKAPLDDFVVRYDNGVGFGVVESKKHFFQKPIDVLSEDLFWDWAIAWHKQHPKLEILQFVPAVRSCFVGEGRRVPAKMGFVYEVRKPAKKPAGNQRCIVTNDSSRPIAIKMHPSWIFPQVLAPGESTEIDLEASTMTSQRSGDINFFGPQRVFFRYHQEAKKPPEVTAVERPLADLPNELSLTDKLMKEGHFPCGCRSCSEDY